MKLSIFSSIARPRNPRLLAGAGALVAVAAVAAIAGAAVMAPSDPGARPSPRTAGALVSGVATVSPSPTATPTPDPTATPIAPKPVPIVPVVSFWSTARSVSRADVAAIWAGNGAAIKRTGYKSMVVAASDADALAVALGAPHGRNVTLLSLPDVRTAVNASTSTIGLIRADDVTPDVQALSVGNVSLFNSERIKDLAKWPLSVMSLNHTAFSAGSTWTLAAGGDINLSRSVFVYAVTRKKGANYPWSAGNAVILRHENWQGFDVVIAKDNGPAGAFKARLADADLAIANLEGPAIDTYVNDLSNNGNNLVFMFDPALLAGLKYAGLDAVSMANNHLRNAGDQGVIQTMADLDALGVAHAGAGLTEAASRQPVWLSAGGQKIALLAYDAIQSGNWATATRPGAAPLNVDEATADIQAARAAGANVVIVMPHWGTEYTYAISATQKAQAAAFVAAGADLVIGSHSHYTTGLQWIQRPNGPAFIDYSLGDLLFDLNWTYRAQEGVIETFTFSGSRLLQVNLSPTITIARSRAGLLNPATDGRTVIDAIHNASSKLPGGW
jgi:hypothetical protein